jgi:hypothetical protein
MLAEYLANALIRLPYVNTRALTDRSTAIPD